MSNTICTILLSTITTFLGVILGWWLSNYKTQKQKNDEKEKIRREKAEKILMLLGELEIQIKKLNELEGKKINNDDLLFSLGEIGKAVAEKIKKFFVLSDLYFPYIFKENDKRYEIFHDFYVYCDLSNDAYEPTPREMVKLFDIKDNFFNSLMEIRDILIEKYEITLTSDSESKE